MKIDDPIADTHHRVRVTCTHVQQLKKMSRLLSVGQHAANSRELSYLGGSRFINPRILILERGSIVVRGATILSNICDG